MEGRNFLYEHASSDTKSFVSICVFITCITVFIFHPNLPSSRRHSLQVTGHVVYAP